MNSPFLTPLASISEGLKEAEQYLFIKLSSSFTVTKMRKRWGGGRIMMTWNDLIVKPNKERTKAFIAGKQYKDVLLLLLYEPLPWKPCVLTLIS